MSGRVTGTSTARVVRTVVAVVAGVIGAVAFVAATVGLWANRTLYDADRFADTIGDAIAEPEVTDALATYLADEALRIIPVERTLGDVLGERLERVAPTATDELHGLAQRRFADLLGRPATRDRVVGLARASHATLVRTIDTGGIANLRLDDDAVTMNLLPVIVDGIDALPTGVLTGALDLPELALDGDHAEQVTRLSEALGVQLPPGTGLITVYRGAAVDRAGTALAQTQRGLVLFHRSLTTLIVAAVVGCAICLATARRRGRALVGLSAGVGVAFLVAVVTLRRAVSQAPSAAADPTNRAVIRAAVRGLSSGLVELSTIATICAFTAALLVAGIGFLLRRPLEPAR